MASRAQLVSEVIEPALAERATILCSRFISATYAYQGAAGYDVSSLLELGNLAVGDCWPDLTIVLDVPIEDGFTRTGRGRPQRQGQSRDAEQDMLFNDARPHDAMEARSLEFHRKVRKRFLSLRGEYPKPVVIVDGTGTPEEVHARVSEAVERVRF
jgi:dTMP kinase